MFKHKEYSTRKLLNGKQYIFKFNNGYGASVVRHNASYGSESGLWELAVIKFEGIDSWSLCYDTEITNDVLGWLSVEDVNTTLDKIIELK